MICPLKGISVVSAYNQKCRCEVCVTEHKRRAVDYYKRNAEKVRAKRAAYRAENRDQENARRREYSQRKPHVIKNQHLLASFNLSLTEYERLSAQQNGLCAICHGTDVTKKLAVDHDHVTGKIRGLLCSSCNLALGMFEDNPGYLHSAMNYLENN